MNLIRPLHLLFAVAAIAVMAPVASAGSRCTDDPERCVERGASVSRPGPAPRAGTARTLAPAPVMITAQPVALTPVRKATTSRKAPKVTRATPNAGTTPAPTPGMGMLLKLSTATGGDVSWSPGGRSQDKDNAVSTGASWIL